MIVTKYTPEDLEKLPLRAIVALAARCARRVESLALPRGDHPEAGRCRAAAASAIQLAEDCAKGLPCPSVERVVYEIESCRVFTAGDFVRESAMETLVLPTHAAATALRACDLRRVPPEAHMFGAAKPNPFPHLADITADLAARDVFAAALTAADAVGHIDTFIKGAVEDYEKLLKLDLGSYPQAGNPIDPSSKGPLGPLEIEECE